MLAVVAADVALYLVFVAQDHSAPLVVTLLNVGFQIFAALCAHYAHNAEQARDRLARVNADMLATRALLADSARDAERSEEHTSELQSLMRITYAAFCLDKKNICSSASEQDNLTQTNKW